MNIARHDKSKAIGADGAHKKATYTLPSDVLKAVDENWRFHETLHERLADSKSEYVADLIRRDAVRKGRKLLTKRANTKS